MRDFLAQKHRMHILALVAAVMCAALCAAGCGNTDGLRYTVHLNWIDDSGTVEGEASAVYELDEHEDIGQLSVSGMSISDKPDLAKALRDADSEAIADAFGPDAAAEIPETVPERALAAATVSSPDKRIILLLTEEHLYSGQLSVRPGCNISEFDAMWDAFTDSLRVS